MNRRTKVISMILALVMVASTVLAGCSSPQGGTSGNQGKATPATLQIGVENKGYGDQFAY